MFDVSSDELLGIDIHNKHNEIKRYFDAYCKWASAIQKTEALRQKTISVLRNGVRMYPNVKMLKQQLVTVLYVNSGEVPISKAEKQEMCRLLGELIDDAVDLPEKGRYISMFCEYARFAGYETQGKVYAKLLSGDDIFGVQRLCYALCCEDENERKNELYYYALSGWGTLCDGLRRIICDEVITSDEICYIREKQEQINAILFDYDDVVKYEDFDEYKVAKAFYKNAR